MVARCVGAYSISFVLISRLSRARNKKKDVKTGCVSLRIIETAPLGTIGSQADKKKLHRRDALLIYLASIQGTARAGDFGIICYLIYREMFSIFWS